MWFTECDVAFDTLKEKLGSAPIFIYPVWNKKFHFHVDSSGIALGIILTQPSEGNLDHPIYFASKNFSNVEKNYTTIEREALTMVYSL